MLDTLYPIDTGAMSQYSDGDWLPSCTTPFMSSLVYPLEDAFPPPEVSFQDPFYSNVEDRGDHHASLLYPPLGFPFHETPLGMKQEPPEERMFRHSPVLSTAGPPPAFNGEMPALEGGRFLSGPPSLIAPDPSMVGRSKRKLEDDSSPDSTSSKRSRRSIGCQQNLELNEEERLLLQLKDQESLPWKDIAIRFQQALGRTHQVPALQMRYKRLREKLRSWTEEDVQALQQAYDYWEKFKWDIIATKMLDFSCRDRWPAKYCQRKWQELHPDALKDSASSIKTWEDSERGSPDLTASPGRTPSRTPAIEQC